MSKAFTSEETPGLGPVTRAAPRVAPGGVRYVTPEGAEALRRELARLEQERAAHGDASDPGAAERLAALASRLALVGQTLAALTVLGPDAAPPSTVGFATWVTVEAGNGVRSTWRIVGPDEADARLGMISSDAPVARARLGRTVGETVEVERPQGRVELTITEVRRSAP
jgi:transcription elongation factor GreB